MYKVFLNNKCIFFQENFNNPFSTETLAIQYISKKQLLSEFEQFEINNTFKNLIIYHQNVDELFNTFLKLFKQIEAAGGLVKNKNDEYLFIFRRGKWDLPKGKLDKNETIKDCAIREVQEECGLQKIKIINELMPTYHIYNLKNKQVIKKTSWFEMLYDGTESPIPQTEEDITKVKWFKKQDMIFPLSDSYPLIVDLVDWYFMR